MNKTVRIGIVGALMVVVGVTMALKQRNREPTPPPDQLQVRAHPESRPAETASERNPTGSDASARGETATIANPDSPHDGAGDQQAPTAPKAVPRLVDLGAGKCIPCKKMAPILEELRKDFAGRLEVVFIDVWENPNAADLFQIRMIPTQIFYDASGKERFRHEGFYSREDILTRWKELGVDLTGKAGASR